MRTAFYTISFTAGVVLMRPSTVLIVLLILATVVGYVALLRTYG